MYVVDPDVYVVLTYTNIPSCILAPGIFVNVSVPTPVIECKVPLISVSSTIGELVPVLHVPGHTFLVNPS